MGGGVIAGEKSKVTAVPQGWGGGLVVTNDASVIYFSTATPISIPSVFFLRKKLYAPLLQLEAKLFSLTLSQDLAFQS